MALGLSPAEYARMSEPMPGLVRIPGGQDQYRWNTKAEPVGATARRTVERLATVVMRLWMENLLRYPEPDDEASGGG
jgi:hypothetical protein